MTDKDLPEKYKDLSLKCSAYQYKVAELNNTITRQEKLIDELRIYIRDNLRTIP